MDSVSTNESYQPRPLAELLPELCGILSRDYVQTLTTAKKKPRSKTDLTRTGLKDVKPLTIAEMKQHMLALKAPSPKRFVQPATSSKKRMWNSSVKVENKTKSHTADGQLKHNSVRKVLNFQPNPRPKVIPKIQSTSETPKFTKPQSKVKKTLQIQAKSSVRISGVFHIPETPVISNKVNKNHMTISNKENVAPKLQKINANSKPQVTPQVRKKSLRPVVPVTPALSMSWKSDSDTSFLRKEKEIQDFDDKAKVVAEEPTLQNIVEVSPPVSTPFKEYRNVQEFFNYTNDTDNSAVYNDNTIMCFDKVSLNTDNSKREESVIVSLCDLLNKASVANTEHPKTELNDLLEVEKQLEHNIKMVDNGIKTLANIKQSQLQSLQCVKKLINEKKNQKSTDNENNNSSDKAKALDVPNIVVEKKLNDCSPVSSKPCSVIKSPSYKIPKRNSCLRKKILYKSMPNVSEGMHTPTKEMDKRALSMYMEMKTKDQMNFLNTPCVKQRSEIPDTPAVTSKNLQMQLDKIYKDNT